MLINLHKLYLNKLFFRNKYRKMKAVRSGNINGFQATSSKGKLANQKVPRSIAATPSLTPSSFCSPTTAATATAGTIAGRSGARKSPDNCQPTVNAVPLHPQQQLQKRYQVSEQQHIQQQ
ncbi:uncharacterized protein ACN427_005703 isoform 1-T1 [Glossina fuscipes fuscipes]